jgi:hypothetical protein
MDNSFEKVITFNNAGAQHLERGDFRSALKALTFAFHSFKKTYNRSKHCTPEKERRRSVSNFNIDGWMKKMTYSEDAEVVIYQHPIRVPESLESSIDSCGLVSTAITFNLALANHLNGLQTKDEAILKTAARLYEYGISLERIRGRFFVSPFFLVSILNNLGHVHRIVDDMGRSQKCFRQLLATLLYLTQTRGADPTDLEVFFGNTSLGLPSSFSHCAGAA